ncbi:MAG TPA: PD-(D/E)XK nuclease family protein [Rhodocyclaceae bacterium]|nr:PD-(D/E)XK nuclease family protein [Rhodocyclaceae bacterium]
MPEVILCATNRLARRLRQQHDEAQRARGLARWAPLDALTLDAWFGRVISAALLAGEINARQAPRLALSALQERMLWERAIATHTEDGEDALFDREGLAAAAADANELMEVWGLRPDGAASEETRRFLRWRRAFRTECEGGGWLEPARWRAWQLQVQAAGCGRLPATVTFAGFDRYNPQERELARLLAARGVTVVELALGREDEAAAVVAALPDRRAECRAAAAWAACRLAENPAARLGLVVPQLAAVRAMLAAALDDALHPEALAPGHAEMPRQYNFSLGTALAERPLVAAALRLLAVAANPRRIATADFGQLLLGPHWSAAASEADGRARLDVLLREQMPPELSLPGVLRLARRMRDRGLRIARSVGHLETLQEFGARHGDQRRPSHWAMVLTELLEAAGWPGERGLSSHEWQAEQALLETLQGLAALDAVLGKVSLGDAVRLTARQCRERVFQPETEGTPALEVMGPLEAAGAEFDALWVLGMNDDVWPPAARPNPLLPAEMQRRARSTNASAEVQLEFALTVQQRLLKSAPEVVFSYAGAEGDRPLRCSPLLQALPRAGELPMDVATAIEALCGSGRVEALDDHLAPPVPAGERLAGGTGLLRAQALCPAWAFFRYRLGARALAEPVEGLGPAERGTLLHRAMEKLWRGRDSAMMAALGEAGRRTAALAAATDALAAFAERRDVPLPARYAALECSHLARLLTEWLALELARPLPFSVAACEQQSRVDIEGLTVDLTLDRLDQLPDGRRVLIDYKTGSQLNVSAWEGERIAEPQLPVYAAWVAGGEDLAAVSFARVRPGECGFVGLSADDGVLPGVKAVGDWSATLMRWRAAIGAIAREIRAGEAGVRFADGGDLRYCDVLPLLRLPERKAQMET